ncbi:MAG TPA: DUF4956 domain-containing protein, partial [Anaerolineales bacterium]|nr:DUF4956 domain-containing protein [Anaerolineales bacterium]
MSAIDLFLGFALNLAIAVLIVRFIYFPASRSKNYVFTFLAFNTIIYFVMSVLAGAEIAVGVGFGLFAIFSVLRYRTNTMATREMTYLFVLIGLPVMNSVLQGEGEWAMLVGLNAAVVATLFVLEREWGFNYSSAKSIRYERLDLVRPENHQALLADLRTRTGLPVTRVEI